MHGGKYLSVCKAYSNNVPARPSQMKKLYISTIDQVSLNSVISKRVGLKGLKIHTHDFICEFLISLIY